MKFLVMIAMCIGVNSFAGPRTVGNGGGGVVRDGFYMTFGSAGLYVDPEPMPMASIPGLELTIQTIRSLGISQASGLQQLVMPFGARKYYNVVKERFDEAAFRALREEYAKLAKVPADSIAIFAVTEPETRRTFLLPEFFGLQPAEQAAILFHEAYWIQKPKATYQDVVRAEIAFQKFVEARAEGKYDPLLADRLGDLYEDRALSLNMHLQHDLKSGALAALGASAQGGVPAWTFLEPGLHCDNHAEYHQGYARGAVVASSRQMEFVYDLSLKHPESFFLRAMVDVLAPEANGRTPTTVFGLTQGQIDRLESLDSRGFCQPYLEKLNLRFVNLAFVDGRLLLEQRWNQPAAMASDKYENSTANGDGSVTLTRPFLLFKGKKAPLLGATKRNFVNEELPFVTVCRYLGFSDYVNESRRLEAIREETDGVTFHSDGSVNAIARYTGVYRSGFQSDIDFMITEITCR